MVEAPCKPVLNGMFHKLDNEKQSLLFQHSFLAVQNFLSTADTSSNANVTTVELSWHVLSKWVAQAVFQEQLDPATS